MADISVERARAGKLAADRNKARNSQQGTMDRLKRSARNFVLPAVAAFALGTGAPQAQPDFGQDETEEDSGQDEAQQDEGQAASNLAFQQNMARQQQAQAAQQQAGQQSRAGAIRGAAQQKGQQQAKQSKQSKASAQAEEAKEEALKKPIRAAQASFWSTAVVGCETIVLTLIFGAFWVAWKTAEFYRTVSGSDLGFLKNFTAKMNKVELLGYLAGLMAVFLIIALIVLIFALVIYALNHKAQVAMEFPSIIPYIWQLF